MDSTESLSDVVRALESFSTRFRPKDRTAVEAATSIAGVFLQSSIQERVDLESVITSTISRKLFALSGFVAEEAVTEKDPSLIETAVLMHLVEGFTLDYRENYRYLVLIVDAAKRVGTNLNDVLSKLEPLANDLSKQALQGFARRDQSLNILESFGIRGEMVGDKFQYSPS
jgi:hypothetical protein